MRRVSMKGIGCARTLRAVYFLKRVHSDVRGYFHAGSAKTIATRQLARVTSITRPGSLPQERASLSGIMYSRCRDARADWIGEAVPVD